MYEAVAVSCDYRRRFQSPFAVFGNGSSTLATIVAENSSVDEALHD